MTYLYILIFFTILMLLWVNSKNKNFYAYIVSFLPFILIIYFNLNLYSILMLIIFYFILCVIKLDNNGSISYLKLLFVLPFIYLLYNSATGSAFSIVKAPNILNNIFVPIFISCALFTLTIVFIYKEGIQES